MSNSSPELDPRVRRTRQLLDQAFMQLVKEKGFQAISVQDITGRAGVNRATFYAHFADKYALLDHSIREAFRGVLEGRLLNKCQLSLENLRLLVVTVCEFVDQLSTQCKTPQPQFDTLVETEVKKQLYDLVLDWLVKDSTRGRHPAVIPERAATAASWAVYGLAIQWSRNKRLPPLDQYAAEVVPIVAANLNLPVQPA